MKKCKSCKQEKEFADFHSDHRNRDGYRGVCKDCNLKKAQIWRDKNREKVREFGRSEEHKSYLREYRKNHKKERADEAKGYRQKHGDKVRASRRDYYEKNKEQLKAYRANYIKQNPWFNRAASARHRAMMLERTPVWVDYEALKFVYKNCPEDKVVDHIVSLRGKTVSGLHVPWNLQYLTFEENSKKSNKLILKNEAD